MAGIVERVRALGLPESQLVVIGSGLLDALGLRHSTDVDLVVTPELFDRLKHDARFSVQHKAEEEYLLVDDAELWLDWKGSTFEDLRDNAMMIDGIAFVHPDILIARKTERGTPKDMNDIALLKDYLHDHTD